MDGLSVSPLMIFLEENKTFLIIKKTEHIKNIGHMVWRGQIGNLPKGGKRGKFLGGTRGKLSGGGKGVKHLRRKGMPLLPQSSSPPLHVNL